MLKNNGSHNRHSPSRRAFSPLSLFSDGSQGVWYDDSDITTMFQDSANTAAVLESPVGLQLDLSQGLALGPDIQNGNFDSDTVWTKNGWVISGGVATSNITAGITQNSPVTLAVGDWVRVTVTVSANSSGFVYAFVAGNTSATLRTNAIGTFTWYFNITTVTNQQVGIYTGNAPSGIVIDNVSIVQISGNHRFQNTSANRPTLSARYNLLTATATLATQSITTVATSYTIYFTGSGTVTLSGTFVGVFSAGTNTFTATAGTLTATVVGSVLTADIRPTDQTTTLPAYQEVVTSSSYDTVGFPQYIRYGTPNSSLSTASINFTATAQVTAFTGQRYTSSTNGVLAELSTKYDTNPGAFFLYGTYVGVSPASGFRDATYSILSSTTTRTSLFDLTAIGTAMNLMRVNGASVTPIYSGAGSGSTNFRNSPLYFGARAGTVLFFNGYEFQTIIVGKTLTATEIANTETYVNSKTRAY